MEKKYLIAVYNNLKQNNKWHNIIKNQTHLYIGEFLSEPIYDIYYINDSNCALLPEGSTSIHFEVYECSEILFNNINFILKSDGWCSKEDAVFNTELINSPFGKVVTYFYNKKINEKIDILIESGNYQDLNIVETIKHGLE